MNMETIKYFERYDRKSNRTYLCLFPKEKSPCLQTETKSSLRIRKQTPHWNFRLRSKSLRTGKEHGVKSSSGPQREISRDWK